MDHILTTLEEAASNARLSTLSHVDWTTTQHHHQVWWTDEAQKQWHTQMAEML